LYHNFDLVNDVENHIENKKNSYNSKNQICLFLISIIRWGYNHSSDYTKQNAIISITV